MMYSAERVQTRFTGFPGPVANHCVVVRLNGSQWQYCNNSSWDNFTPVSTDRLLAELDFSNDTAKNLGWRHVFYSSGSQALEERLGSQSDAQRQFVWNLGYVDDLVLRDRDTTDDGTLDERLYSLPDLRYSVMALTDDSGTVVERLTYDAYGAASVIGRLLCFSPSSSYDWEFRYTGRREDLNTGLYYFRARYYSAHLGRFISRDPLGFVDGLNLYRAYFVSRDVDPFGLFVQEGCYFRGPSQTAHMNHKCHERYGPLGIPTGPTQTDPIDLICTSIFVIDCATAGPNEGLVVIATIKACTTRGGKVISKQITKKVTSKACNKKTCKPKTPKPKGCKPCFPPAGKVFYQTIYQIDSIDPRIRDMRERGKHAHPPYNTGHVKLWKINQTPYPKCKCKINKMKTLEFTLFPPAGAVPYPNPGPLFVFGGGPIR